VDTREKIVPLSDLARRMAGHSWLAVVGLFDPLTAVEAKRLAGVARDGRKLLAVVLDAQDTLLEANARAVLVAALRTVDLVTTAGGPEWRHAVPPEMELGIIEDMTADRARSAQFVQFILNRHHAAARNTA
jgi:mannitol-1-phosphate/altronate dehydrogenase